MKVPYLRSVLFFISTGFSQIYGKSAPHIALPEGQTLPENLWRFRSVHKFYEGSKGYDKDGHSYSSGFSGEGHGSGWVLEYGLTDKVSLQVLVPYYYRQSVVLDGENFRETDLYQSEYQKAMDLVTGKLVEKGLCPNKGACEGLVKSGFRLPQGQTITVPHSGEQLVISSEEEIQVFIDRFILNGAAPSGNGKVGLGDVETGILWNVFRSPQWSFSMGMGLRWPTGSFKDVPQGYRPTGGGIYELGTRLNLDYELCSGLWLSYQDQLEIPLNTAERKRSSDASPDSFLPEDTTTPILYKKKSPTREAFLKVNYGLGVLSSYLEPYGVFGSYIYKKDGTMEIDGHVKRKAQSLHWGTFGAYVDGRNYGVPFGFDIERRIPLGGRNALVAPDITVLSLKMYAKF
jgi:hypothetical protein